MSLIAASKVKMMAKTMLMFSHTAMSSGLSSNRVSIITMVFSTMQSMMPFSNTDHSERSKNRARNMLVGRSST